MRLRDVEPTDLDVYLRMRCDPIMMAELGGPQPQERVIHQLKRDVETVQDDSAWVKMILSQDGLQVAGTVTVYSHEGISEIGWMVLPEFQGRGMASEAVRAVLDLARTDGGGDPSTPSRAKRMRLRTPSAAQPASRSPVRRKRPSPVASSRPTIGFSNRQRSPDHCFHQLLDLRLQRTDIGMSGRCGRVHGCDRDSAPCRSGLPVGSRRGRWRSQVNDLRHIGRAFINFDNGSFQWVDVQRFRLTTPPEPNHPDLLAAVIAHDTFGNDYATRPGDNPERHGPYWRDRITPASYDRVDPAAAERELRT